MTLVTRDIHVEFEADDGDIAVVLDGIAYVITGRLEQEAALGRVAEPSVSLLREVNA